MSYSYKCYSDTKDIMKKYVNAVEGAAIYGLVKQELWLWQRRQEQYIKSVIQL